MQIVEDNVGELLHDLLKAKVEIVRDDDGWNFFTYNDTLTLAEFEDDLISMYHSAIKEISIVISSLEIDPENYINGIIMQIEDIMEEFIISENLLFKKNLSINNLRGIETTQEMVTAKCKQTISSFVTLQKEITEKIFNKLKKSLPSATPVNIKWTGYKIDLVEISLALFNSNVILKDGRPITKSECVNFVTSMFGEEIKNPQKTISKLYERGNPATFLERLTDLLKKSQFKRDSFSDN